jgi:hypothetical protein
MVKKNAPRSAGPTSTQTGADHSTLAGLPPILFFEKPPSRIVSDPVFLHLIPTTTGTISYHLRTQRAAPLNLNTMQTTAFLKKSGPGEKRHLMLMTQQAT